MFALSVIATCRLVTLSLPEIWPYFSYVDGYSYDNDPVEAIELLWWW